MSARDRLRHIKPAYDPASPPPGVRLRLGTVATRLGISVTDMAEACDISRTAISNLLSNQWPVKTPAEELRAALTGYFACHGATDGDLETLFHALGSGHGKTKAAADAAEDPPTEDEDTMLISAQTLSPQARRHFKLFSNPFLGDVTSEAQMFVGPEVAYVREAAWQCALNGGLVGIVGESGAGKTTILADLEARLESDPRGVVVIKPSVLGMELNDSQGKAIKSADILHAVITTVDPQATVPQTLAARTTKAQKLLTASMQAGNAHLLVVEEAHSMPDATLKHLKRLHELRMGRRPLLGILLLAQPELKARLASGLRSGVLREVAQRLELVELLPLDADLKPYLERRAAAAGAQLAALVDDAAIEALRTRLTRKVSKDVAISMCYPLVVGNLLTAAMNKAAEIPRATVTAGVIELL